jgi:hypothetical protein
MTCDRCRNDVGPDVIYVVGNADPCSSRLLCAACAHAGLPAGFWDRMHRFSHFQACRVCGRRRYYSASWPHIYCTAACERQARRERRRRPRGQKPGVCARCEQSFTASRSDAHYCSPACRQMAYRQRERQAEL